MPERASDRDASTRLLPPSPLSRGSGSSISTAAIIATAHLANAVAIIGNDRQWRSKPRGVPYHHMDDILALT